MPTTGFFSEVVETSVKWPFFIKLSESESLAQGTSMYFDYVELFNITVLVFAYLISTVFTGFLQAYVTTFLGDHTAEEEGFLSLNPYYYFDFIGFMALFVFGYGWGAQVPINRYNLFPPYEKLKYYLATSSRAFFCFLLAFFGMLFLKGMTVYLGSGMLIPSYIVMLITTFVKALVSYNILGSFIYIFYPFTTWAILEIASGLGYDLTEEDHHIILFIQLIILILGSSYFNYVIIALYSGLYNLIF
ncbi:MAG: hypothetical protein ABUT20_53005 [Bacteroidota bacterium]